MSEVCEKGNLGSKIYFFCQQGKMLGMVGHITYFMESGGFRPGFPCYKLRPVFFSMRAKCS